MNEFVTGGLFAIKRSVWESVGGMKTIFNRSQDWDLGLRLAKEFSCIVVKKYLRIIIHYHQKNLLTNVGYDIISGYKLYRIVLLRENFFNIFQWRHL